MKKWWRENWKFVALGVGIVTAGIIAAVILDAVLNPPRKVVEPPWEGQRYGEGAEATMVSQPTGTQFIRPEAFLYPTNGCPSYVMVEESLLIYDVIDFDASTPESCYAVIALPRNDDDYALDSIELSVIWMASTKHGGNATWSVTIYTPTSDNSLARNACTINSPTTGHGTVNYGCVTLRNIDTNDYAHVKLVRLASAESDNLAADARLLGLSVKTYGHMLSLKDVTDLLKQLLASQRRTNALLYACLLRDDSSEETRAWIRACVERYYERGIR